MLSIRFVYSIIGAAKSIEEAKEVEKVFDEAGAISIFRDKVHLHPNKVLDMVRIVVPLALMPEDDPQKEELKKLQAKQEEIDVLTQSKSGTSYGVGWGSYLHKPIIVRKEKNLPWMKKKAAMDEVVSAKEIAKIAHVEIKNGKKVLNILDKKKGANVIEPKRTIGNKFEEIREQERVPGIENRKPLSLQKPLQTHPKSKKRKRTNIPTEPEVYIVGLHYTRSPVQRRACD
ncbi:calcium uniporter protein 6, mitochondrial-like protein [Tanacetum coccineum]